MTDYKKKKNKLGSITQQLFEIGKQPPQALDLEEAVLGALMLENGLISEVIDILRPESFYKEAHAIIYRTIIGLFKRSQPIDIITVTNAVKAEGWLEQVGGAYYISQLTNRVASGAHTEFHARIISQMHMMREMIRHGSNMVKKGYDNNTDVFDLINEGQTFLNDILTDNIKSIGVDATAAFTELIQHLERASLNTEEITGVATTIAELDRITNGWQKSDLIIVAGRPGSGKTALTKACIKGAMRQKKVTAFFSLEMSTLQVMARLISEDVGVSAQTLLQGKFEGQTNFNFINSAITKYYSENGKPLIYIDDSPFMTIVELRAKAKRLKSKMDIGLLIVDYLQLISGGNDDGNRVTEIDKICAGLKGLAKELDIPVIALAQLSRAVETQGGEMKPKLSHLRESGGIEQFADLVLFLWRPDYYVKQGMQSFAEVEYKGQMISSEGFAELIIAKHRNGALGVVPAKFIDYLTQFKNWEEPPSYSTSPANIVQPPENAPPTGIQPNTDFLKDNKDDAFETPPF